MERNPRQDNLKSTELSYSIYLAFRQIGTHYLKKILYLDFLCSKFEKPAASSQPVDMYPKVSLTYLYFLYSKFEKPAASIAITVFTISYESPLY